MKESEIKAMFGTSDNKVILLLSEILLNVFIIRELFQMVQVSFNIKFY